MSRNFSGAVVGSVGSVQLQIAPRSSLHFLISVGPFRCRRCYLQGVNLLQRSLLKRFPLFTWLLSGPAFCAVPPEQLRPPGAWRAHSPRCGAPPPLRGPSLGFGAPLGCALCLFLEAAL